MNRKQEVVCWIIGLTVAWAMVIDGYTDLQFGLTISEQTVRASVVALVGTLAVYSLRSRRTDTGLRVLAAGLSVAMALAASEALKSLNVTYGLREIAESLRRG